MHVTISESTPSAGVIRTPLIENSIANSLDAAVAEKCLPDLHPTEHLEKVEDVVHAVMWLA